MCACRCYLWAVLHNIYLMVSYDVAYASVPRSNSNFLFKFTFELSLCLIGKPFFTCVVSFDFIDPLLVNPILRPNDTTISEELVIKKKLLRFRTKLPRFHVSQIAEILHLPVFPLNFDRLKLY